MKFIIIKLKRLVFPICILMFIFLLILFSNKNIIAVKSSLYLWANSVVPTLLPFFIVTELLSYTNILQVLGRILNVFMRPLFNVPGESAFALIMGIITGYPVGAKIVCNLKQNNICTDIECERLIAFTNNSGPLFIIGTVGIGMFKNSKIGVLLLITHILSCITVGILFRWWKYKKDINYNFLKNKKTKVAKPLLSIYNLGEVMSKSILNSINTLLLIGGFIVLFSVIISILNNSKFILLVSSVLTPIFKIPSKYCSSFITGLIELTNGIYNISNIIDKNISTGIILCSFLLGFGGISIAMQVLSIISKYKISIKPYLIGKLLQGVFSAFYTYIMIIAFPFLV